VPSPEARQNVRVRCGDPSGQSVRVELSRWQGWGAMVEPNFEIADIIIDCSDPVRLASFWADVLGRPIEGCKGPYVWLKRSTGAPGVGFQQVEEAKAGKNRVHLDISVADVVVAKTRIEALGGRSIEGYESGGFLVMTDPEGNEFCLVPAAPFQFDESGRADYLDNLEM
jgi:predicted enzyme related to lactoylglutathione lyase